MKNEKNKKIFIAALIVSGVLTVLICLIMNMVLIPKIEAGNPPMRAFDMCSTGYSAEQARAFVLWLSDDAKATYLNAQLPLDFFYPIAYAAFFALLWLAVGGKKWGIAFPVALALFDYIENSLVIVMLKNASFADSVAKIASVATVIKSVLMYVIIVAEIVALIVCIVRKKKKKQTSNE